MGFGIWELGVAALIGYVFGSLPTGYLVVKWKTGQDVRKVGSGRTGGTNVLRAAGSRAFLITVLGDVNKGMWSALIARWLLQSDDLMLVTGFCTLVGNNWSLFLRGKGGAGMMTGAGTLLAIAPLPILILTAPLLLVFRLSRIA